MTRTSKTSQCRKDGRGLFYSRDSGGEHEQTPAQYVAWAKHKADELGICFDGSGAQIERLMKNRIPHEGDIFFDFCVQGNLLSRPALDALKSEIKRDKSVSHVFIPRRNRLARPDHAIDGVRLEKELRELGITLVFMEASLPPLRKGQRQEIGEAITAMVAYEESGRFRDELAEKMIYSQLQLAQHGYSTGGRAPFGFRRHLIGDAGNVVRELTNGEIIRQKGHHVVWLPGPNSELDLIRRIIEMLETMPAARVARMLSDEGVPSPDAGRYRRDHGVRHAVSGKWHATTITNIARNPLLRLTTSYGRRSMGDRRRVTPQGPREVDLTDFRPDEKPKVIQNPESQRIVAKAHGDPVLPVERIEQLITKLDQRAGTQKGKPRARNPDLNPLGARIFDMACRWPMYRVPYSGSFRYTCGFYQQTHGQSCDHNHIAGPIATKFGLAVVRHLLQGAPTQEKLAEKIREKLARRAEDSGCDRRLQAVRDELQDLSEAIGTGTSNLTRAKSTVIFEGIQSELEKLHTRKSQLEVELLKLESPHRPSVDADDHVEHSLHQLKGLEQLAENPENLADIGQLFRRINLQMFLRFQQVQQKKRTVNRLASGVVTVGAVSPPITKYEGPTGKVTLRSPKKANKTSTGDSAKADSSNNSGEAEESLGNVNRDDRI